HLGPHELGEAADVHVVGDLRSRAQLDEGAAVRPVADPRVLYMYVRADAAVGADGGVSLEHREGFDDRVQPDGNARVDEGGGRVDDGDTRQHQPVEDPALDDRSGGGEPDAVLDAHRFVRVDELDHGHRLQVQEDVGE